MFQTGYIPETATVKGTEMSRRVNLKKGYKATEPFWLAERTYFAFWQNGGQTLRASIR